MTKHTKLLTFAIVAAIVAPQTFASGYNFGTQSLGAMSTADAAAAEADNPSTIYYNPAGLTELSGAQITGNLIIAQPSVKYHDARAYYPSGSPSTIAGDSNGKLTKGVTLVPHGYFSYQINPRLTAGVGVYVPFGATTDYSSSSPLRYSISKIQLSTIDINPAIAFKVAPNHSIGVGIIAQYANAQLNKYANFSPSFAAYNVPNGYADGLAQMKADAWGLGFNIGWMWDVNESIRVGASYRSPVRHKLNGTTKWELVGPLFNTDSNVNPYSSLAAKATAGVRQAGYVESESASAKITTPESLSLHGRIQVTPQANLFGNVTWTHHARFNDLNIQLGNTKRVIGGTSNISSFKPQWKDSWRIALGGSYQITEPLQLRAGISWDQSPVKDAEHRLTAMPDNDRLWLSLGAKYDFSKNSSLTLGYSYMHVKNSQVNYKGCTAPCVDSQTFGTAKYKSHANFYGLQYTHRF